MLSTSLHIDRVNRDALDPGILHSASHIKGGIMRNQRTNKIQSGVQTSRDTARCNDTHATEGELGTPGDGLAALGVLPGIAALASNGLSPAVLCVGALVTGLLDDVGVVVGVLAQVESAEMALSANLTNITRVSAALTGHC